MEIKQKKKPRKTSNEDLVREINYYRDSYLEHYHNIRREIDINIEPKLEGYSTDILNLFDRVENLNARFKLFELSLSGHMNLLEKVNCRCKIYGSGSEYGCDGCNNKGYFYKEKIK